MDAIDVTDPFASGGYRREDSVTRPPPAAQSMDDPPAHPLSIGDAVPLIDETKPPKYTAPTSWDTNWERVYAIHGWENGKIFYKLFIWAITIGTGFLMMGAIAGLSYLYDRVHQCLPKEILQLEMTGVEQGLYCVDI